MPANGTAVVRLFPEPAPAAGATADKPTPAAPNPTEIETAIGEATADAAVAIAVALETYKCHGTLLPAVKETGAEAVAKVAGLQLDSLGEIPNFSAVALAEGRRVLNQRHGAAFRQQLNLSEEALDQAINWYVNSALEVVGRVVADEMVYRRAWSN